jgi:hypothetical protein
MGSGCWIEGIFHYRGAMIPLSKMSSRNGPRNTRSLGYAPNDTSGGLGPQQPHSSQKKA